MHVVSCKPAYIVSRTALLRFHHHTLTHSAENFSLQMALGFCTMTVTQVQFLTPAHDQLVAHKMSLVVCGDA